jgi:SAM-dependent methyltransferase
MLGNINQDVVKDFGREWQRFDQSLLSVDELHRLFKTYFAVFPWERLSPRARGFDLGCGSGRWAKFVAQRVGELHCIDPSAEALDVARRNLAGLENCRLHLASVDSIPLEDGSMDFAYSLGVLHHVPDTARGIRDCVAKLKRGAPLLLYLYHAFENRPLWFSGLWKASDIVWRAVSQAPFPVKYAFSQLIAVLFYFPLARAAHIIERLGIDVANVPLSMYRDKSFYTMRTDALDRFGTRLERRFTKEQIEDMMLAAGLVDIRFSDAPPYWCVIGYKA